MMTVGIRLKTTRLQRGISIAEVAKATRIKPEFIEALEEGNYASIPSSTYAQGFLKNYSRFLHLNEKQMLALFRREYDEQEASGVLPASFTRSQPFAGFRLGSMTVVIGSVFILVVGFVGFQYRAAVLPPSLTITAPQEGERLETAVVRVSGRTEANATVTVNGIPATVEKDGSFQRDIAVFAGTNTITIRAVNTFGRVSTIIREIRIARRE
jgi:cytoskeletal protein RodZ